MYYKYKHIYVHDTYCANLIIYVWVCLFMYGLVGLVKDWQNEPEKKSFCDHMVMALLSPAQK